MERLEKMAMMESLDQLVYLATREQLERRESPESEPQVTLVMMELTVMMELRESLADRVSREQLEKLVNLVRKAILEKLGPRALTDHKDLLDNQENRAQRASRAQKVKVETTEKREMSAHQDPEDKRELLENSVRTETCLLSWTPSPVAIPESSLSGSTLSAKF